MMLQSTNITMITYLNNKGNDKMKTLILALALASISTNTMARSYTDEVKIKYGCETLGNLSKVSYQTKKLKGSLEELNQMVEERVGKDSKETMYQLVKMGYEAGSEEEAYMLGWSHCMDEYS